MLNLIVDGMGTDHFGKLKVVSEGLERGSDGSISAVKNVTFSGPYMVFGEENKNQRSYILEEGIREVQKYQEMIAGGNAVGELEHPANASVNLDRVCHRCTDLYIEGNIAYGKSAVSMNTTCGRQLAGLMIDGITIGTSSRGVGKIVHESSGTKVKEFSYLCNDMVHDPSGPGCYVDNVLENKAFVVGDGGVIVECAYDALEKDLSKMGVSNNGHTEDKARAYFKFCEKIKNASK